MTFKRLLVPFIAGMSTVAFCLLVPVPDGAGNHEPSFMALVHRLANVTWIEDTKKHAAFVLHALMYPVLHRHEQERPPEAPGADTPEVADQTPDQPAEPGRDLTGLREAIAFCKASDIAHGDEAAKTAKDDLVRRTLDWVAVKTSPHEVGFVRLQRFAAAHQDWPALGWLRRRAEEALYAEHRDKATVQAFFATAQPDTPFGKLLLAQAFIADGHVPEAQKLIRDLWRET